MPINRFLGEVVAPLPERPFEVRFVGSQEAGARVWQVRHEPGAPAAPRAEPWRALTLLALARKGGVPLRHVCGGLASCGTCRVRVTGGGGSLNPIHPLERETLEAEGLAVDGTIRLACQCIPDGSLDVEVVILPPASGSEPESRAEPTP